MAIQNIVLIGAGRVATQLGKTLVASNKTIVQVYSLTLENATKLAKTIKSAAINDLSQLDRTADLYIISLVDDALPDILKQLSLGNLPLVHTSGSVAMEILKETGKNFGVFYPLQTFSKTKDVSFDDIPLCIEASSKNLEKELMALGGEISNDVRLLNSEQRLSVHIAAVFANNFTNFMYLMSEDILEKSGVSFDILIPLIRETAEKITHSLPRDAQTGPAARGDEQIIQKHLKELEALPLPDHKLIYETLSQFITAYMKDHYHKK